MATKKANISATPTFLSTTKTTMTTTTTTTTPSPQQDHWKTANATRIVVSVVTAAAAAAVVIVIVAQAQSGILPVSTGSTAAAAASTPPPLVLWKRWISNSLTAIDTEAETTTTTSTTTGTTNHFLHGPDSDATTKEDDSENRQTRSPAKQPPPQFQQQQPLPHEQAESPYWIIIDGGSTGSRLHIFEFVRFNNENESSSTSSKLQTLQCVRRGSARANVPLSSFWKDSRHERRDAENNPPSNDIHNNDDEGNRCNQHHSNHQDHSLPDDPTETTETPNNEETCRLPPQSSSSLLLNATHVAEHLIPAFQYAAEQIPPQYHATTRVLYQATAGMRLLTPEQQAAIYDTLHEGLMQHSQFVFRNMKRHDIETLSGELEAFYGAVAANYLQGTIDTSLQLMSADQSSSSSTTTTRTTTAAIRQHHQGPIGALDMGGASTQIVFLPGYMQHQSHSTHAKCSEYDDQYTGNTDDNAGSEQRQCQHHLLPFKLRGPDFFSTSYLSYGADEFRERLWTTWVREHQAKVTEQNACDAHVLENPCTFKGYQMQWHGYTFIGTGDAHECVQQVLRLIPHPEETDQHQWLGRQVGGVQHPPVRGKFLAMSLYFFTLDSLRVLSRGKASETLNASWPTPSIQELFDALEGMCSRSWQGDLEEIQHAAHAFTRPEVLPHRCLESVYMVTLLRDGFGFDPESRDITFTFLVDGSEVEWSLGMALALHAQGVDEKERAMQKSSLSSSSSTTTPSEPLQSLWNEQQQSKQQPAVATNQTRPPRPATLTRTSRRVWEILLHPLWS